MQRKPATRRQLRAALRALQPLMPHPWTLDGFVANLADSRGRPIELRPSTFRVLQDGNRASAMWVERSDMDVIYWDITRPALREAAVSHEVAHIFLDHPRNVLTDEDVLEDGGGSNDGRSARVLYRHDYEADVEKEAEALGTLLVYDIAQRQLRRAPSTTSLVARQLR